MRMGGLGIRSAHATDSASWSDALHMIHQRTPAVAESVVTALSQEEQPGGGCVGELPRCCCAAGPRGLLVETQLGSTTQRRKTTADDDGEPGEWAHGWQYCASSVSDTFFRKALLSDRTAARQAHLWFL